MGGVLLGRLGSTGGDGSAVRPTSGLGLNSRVGRYRRTGGPSVGSLAAAVIGSQPLPGAQRRMGLTLERLRIQVREIQETRADLNDAIVACGKVIDHASTEEIIERMNDIREKENQLADRIGYFKVE